MSCTASSPQACTVSCPYKLYLNSQTASVSLKELANELVIGWIEVADDALSGRFSFQYMNCH